MERLAETLLGDGRRCGGCVASSAVESGIVEIISRRIRGSAIPLQQPQCSAHLVLDWAKCHKPESEGRHLLRNPALSGERKQLCEGSTLSAWRAKHSTAYIASSPLIAFINQPFDSFYNN